MCIEAQKMSNKAQEHMEKNEFLLAGKYFDKSNKLYIEANKFIEEINNE